MGTARNPITGDLIKTKANSKQFQDNYSKIYGDKPPQRGRYIYDEELRKLLPADEWYARNYKERNQSPMAFVDNMEAYESPVTGKIITNRKKRDYDLRATGSRPYEGFSSEQKEAQKYQQYQDQKLKSTLSETVQRTYYEIEHGYRKLED